MIAMEVKYKKTGVDWIPEVPEHWDIVRLKWVLKNGEGIKIGPFGSSLKLQDLDDNGIRVYGQENVIKDDFSLGKRFLSKDKFEELSVYEVFPQDILVTMMGTTGKCKLVPKDAEKGIMDSHLIRLRTNDKIRPEFLSILINDSMQLKYQMSIDSKGSIMSGLNSKIVKNLLLPLPSIKDQDLILEIIKTESEQISRFLQSKQRFIELLKEQRQSIITNAVTKGIDENVKMKETGIDWMPEVPEHWEVRKIRRIFNGISSGTTPESGNLKYYENGYVNWINTGDLNDNTLTGCKYKVTKKALDDYPTLKIYPSGTVLVAMYGATIGKVSLLEIEGCTNQACCALYDSDIYSKEFSLYSILASKDALIRESYGGGQPNINQDVIKRFKLPVPPPEEQKQIVEFIKSEIQILDIAISKAEREIELMKEYREAMIAEAVTGKFLNKIK